MKQTRRCPFCLTNLTEADNKEEHLKTHETLRHMKIPIKYKNKTFSISSGHLINAYFCLPGEMRK